MNDLHKILPIFVLPIGLSILLVLVGLKLRRRIFIVVGLAVLWLSSTPLISRLAIRSAEGWAERGLAVDARNADAIVVLSQGRITAPGKAAISEWIDGDRFFGGIELFNAKKAPLLVFTGGALPSDPTAQLEGDVLALDAKVMGVPDAQIAVTSRVTNTAEEALAVSALLRGRLSLSLESHGGSPRILLVTSAYHMPRARWLFERAGMYVIPFPVDFQVSADGTISVLGFLPTAMALAQTELALREAYGRLFYLVVK